MDVARGARATTQLVAVDRVAFGGQDPVLGEPGEQHGAPDPVERTGVHGGKRPLKIDVGGALSQGPQRVSRLGSSEPLRMSADPFEEQPPSAR